MSTATHATFGGQPLRVNPESVNWNFTIKTNAVETVGGRVVQVFGTDLGDLTVSGHFGVGGWKEQKTFLDRIITLADLQVKGGQVKNSKINPISFTYPLRKWDFQVYLLGYDEPGAGASVRWSPDNPNPGWQLRLFIVQDNGGIVKVAQDAFIARFAEGLGWKQKEFNGPMQKVNGNINDLATALEVSYGITDPKNPGSQPHP